MKYLIFILLFAVCFSGFSQTNYQKGFIVSNSGDTTRGFINYKEWGKNPEHISFKTSDDADRRRQIASRDALKAKRSSDLPASESGSLACSGRTRCRVSDGEEATGRRRGRQARPLVLQSAQVRTEPE